MSIKSSVLFGLGLVDSVLREFHDPGEFVSLSYKNLYGFVPKAYKRENLYSVANALKKSGDIVSSKPGSFHLTKEGTEQLFNASPPLRYLHKPWDGKWRVVGFDIEEKNRMFRDALRRFLIRFGFGMLQKSLYVSPLPFEEDVEKFLSSHRQILPNVYIFVSERFFLEDREGFIDRIFSIQTINNSYTSILKRVKDGVKEQEKDEILRECLEISKKDPLLPKELLPKSFARESVWRALEDKGIFSSKEF